MTGLPKTQSANHKEPSPKIPQRDCVRDSGQNLALNPKSTHQPADASGQNHTTLPPLLAVLNRVTPRWTPVWFMRQAGRSLPEYHRVRQGIGMLEACVKPDLTAEITLQPVRRYQVDGAIFFSDIVTPLYLAGVGVQIVKGQGPVFDQPVRDRQDLKRLTARKEFDPEVITQAAQLVRQALPDSVTLIGFAGAPFTLASYLVSTVAGKHHLAARAMMKSDPQAWQELAAWCADLSTRFLAAQITGGAQAIQLFDSWAGDLPVCDYQQFCLPHSTKILQSAQRAGAKTIHFGLGTAPLLSLLRQAGVDCLGIDWRTSLSAAVKLTSAGFSTPPVVQGNIDPAVLFAPEEVIRQHVAQVLQQGKMAGGHIVNLGHGVPPQTDPQVLRMIVDQVHQA